MVLRCLVFSLSVQVDFLPYHVNTLNEQALRPGVRGGTKVARRRYTRYMATTRIFRILLWLIAQFLSCLAAPVFVTWIS